MIWKRQIRNCLLVVIAMAIPAMAAESNAEIESQLRQEFAGRLLFFEYHFPGLNSSLA